MLIIVFNQLKFETVIWLELYLSSRTALYHIALLLVCQTSLICFTGQLKRKKAGFRQGSHTHAQMHAHMCTDMPSLVGFYEKMDYNAFVDKASRYRFFSPVNRSKAD